MKPRGYVLLLLEEAIQGSTPIGYWNGKKYYAEDVCFPGVLYEKNDKRTKVYKNKINAEKAVLRVKETFEQIKDAEIETIY